MHWISSKLRFIDLLVNHGEFASLAATRAQSDSVLSIQATMITFFEAKKIITMNPSNPEATHVAVRDSKDSW